MKTHKTQFLTILAVLITAGLTAQAQYTYTTINGTITITGYTGTGGAVTIPSTINGLPVTDIGTNAFYNSALTSVVIPDSVTNIGDEAFYGCTELTNVTIPDSVTSIGNDAFSGPADKEVGLLLGLCNGSPLTTVMIPSSVTNIGIGAFEGCANLTSITIPNSVTGIADYAFCDCLNLTNVTIPDSVTSIGNYAFSGGGYVLYNNGPSWILVGCRLTSVTIPKSVTTIGDYAFAGCLVLTNVYFLGNAPSADSTVFNNDSVYGDILTAYYLPGTTGWAEFTSNTGVPTALWTLPNPLVLNGSSGVLNNQFGFTISWATNVPVVVEASADLSYPIWTPIATNTLSSGTSSFSDPDWTNYPNRFYRLRSQ